MARGAELIAVEGGVLALSFGDLDELKRRMPSFHDTLLHALAASAASAGGGGGMGDAPSPAALVGRVPSLNWTLRAAETPPEAFVLEMRAKAELAASHALGGSKLGGGGGGGGSGPPPLTAGKARAARSRLATTTTRRAAAATTARAPRR